MSPVTMKISCEKLKSAVCIALQLVTETSYLFKISFDMTGLGNTCDFIHPPKRCCCRLQIHFYMFQITEKYTCTCKQNHSISLHIRQFYFLYKHVNSIFRSQKNIDVDVSSSLHFLSLPLLCIFSSPLCITVFSVLFLFQTERSPPFALTELTEIQGS
jgi:hypothetical protein